MTKLKKFLLNKNEKIKMKFFLFMSFILTMNQAYADYDIGGPDDGPLARITAFIQDVVNWVDGPVALAFSFFCIAGMAITWAVAPKMVAAMGIFVRITVAVIVILNIGVWIAAYNS